MTEDQLFARFSELCREDLPAPGSSLSSYRYRRIFEVGQQDLSLAKLAEAHWDAVAILREAGQTPEPGARYAVWASEIPGRELQMSSRGVTTITGTKQFCSGAGLVDRALITAGPGGECLVEIDLHAKPEALGVDGSGWSTEAFRITHTSALTFLEYPVISIIGEHNWYVERSGFWPGACSPAAAWAGGAAGLVDFAMGSRRDDGHTAAHLAAMQANVWASKVYLLAAAEEFERPHDNGMVRALTVRHLVEQACTDTLRRFARTMGPGPMAKNADISRRYSELDLFLRQSHAERDLESLGRALRLEDRVRIPA